MRAFLLLLTGALPLAGQFAGWPPPPQEAMQRILRGEAGAAVQLLRTEAEAGGVTAMFWLGRALEEVEGVRHDYAEAYVWYTRAAEKGSGPAAWSAGRMHEMGRGRSLDLQEAMRWYEKAAALGFRRTALTILFLTWMPGPEELRYEGLPEPMRTLSPHSSPERAYLDRPVPELQPDELELLKKAGLRGRLRWQGGEPGLFGLPARVVLIARRPVEGDVRLALSVEGTLFYVQRDEDWQRLGAGAAGERAVRLAPQSPQEVWATSYMVEREEGGLQGGTGWHWRRR
jgi:hypothetical protein